MHIGYDGKIAYLCQAQVHRLGIFKFDLRKEAQFMVINTNCLLEHFPDTDLPCLDDAKIRTGIIFGRGTIHAKVHNIIKIYSKFD